MDYGYCGKILRINLETASIKEERLGEEFYRRYFGGRALIAYYLLNELKPGVDPLDPDNLLIFATGVLTGHPFSGSGRNSVGGKSPLTEAYGDSEVGGYWGAELKKTGFDAIIIESASEEPVYLWIHNGKPEIKSAKHLWGKPTAEVEHKIRKELGEPAARVAQIGPAGERLVRYACIINDLSHAAGRTGMGAVMGSKKLRAVVVKGETPPKLADPEGVKKLAKSLIGSDAEMPMGRTIKVFRRTGTSGFLLGLNASSGLPTRNFQQGSFEHAEEISGERMAETILVGRRSCYACSVICKRTVEVDDPYKVDPTYGGPEYETLAAFGSNCGIKSLEAVAKANEICNANGIDTISTGACIAFAMECYEKGLLTDKDTGGITLNFGSETAMLKMLESIVEKKGFGVTLAKGVMRAAEEIGKGSLEYALHVKGQEVPMHEPRFKKALGVGYAVSPTGADHCHNLHDSLFTGEGKQLDEIKALGVLKPLPAKDLSGEKVRLLTYASNWRHFINCAVICYFLPYYYDELPNIVKMICGWNTTLWELMKVGERAATMARAFNVREGFKADDDNLPDRFSTPFEEGPIAGETLPNSKLNELKKMYYGMMGWNIETGVPTKEKLFELDIGWIVDALF